MPVENAEWGPNEEILEEKCPVCENYQRKIEEVEQNLSGREALVTALENRLQKWEGNYKKLFDEYEHLRFRHSSAMQDNFSLKEINAKLEEATIQKKTCCTCYGSPPRGIQCYVEKLDNQGLQELQNSRFYPIFQEYHNIEQLLQDQNTIFRELILKILNELKIYENTENQALIQDIKKILEDLKPTDTSNQLELAQRISQEIVRKPIVEIQKEISVLRKDTSEKRSVHTMCSNVPSVIIEETPSKHSKQDQVIYTTNMEDPEICSKLREMKLQMKAKEEKFAECSCQMIEQLTEMADNNQALSDTLTVMTAENKSNLETISKLKSELERVNEHSEKKTEHLKVRVTELESIVEEQKINEKKHLQIIDQTETEINSLKEQVQHLVDENSKFKHCSCDAQTEFKSKLAIAEMENEELRKELRERLLEITEYEEDNRSMCQKIEVITAYNEELTHKLRLIEEGFKNKPQQTHKHCQADSPSLEEEKLKALVSKLETQKKELIERCKHQEMEVVQKVQQMETLQSAMKAQSLEIDKLTSERIKLRQDVEKLKMEKEYETGKLQNMVDHSQKQVELLLKEHDEKTAQIENVAKELDHIRRSVTEDNDSYLSKIRNLEKERDELKKRLENYEIYNEEEIKTEITKLDKQRDQLKKRLEENAKVCDCKKIVDQILALQKERDDLRNALKSKQNDCNCDAVQEEIEILKTELLKKQCIISELEKSIDNFNETLQNFDKTAEELACENSCLKKERLALAEELEMLNTKLNEKNKAVKNLTEALEDMQRTTEKQRRTSINLEEENKKLNKLGQSIQNKNQNIEAENEVLKKELVKLKQQKLQDEKQFVMDAHQLHQEVEMLRDERAKKDRALNDLQKAYDEVKSLFDKSNAENEKLKIDIRNCAKCLEITKQACACLKTDNENLKERSSRLKEEVDNVRGACEERIKRCGVQCEELERLRNLVDQLERDKRLQEINSREMKQKCKMNQMELEELKGKVDTFRRSYDEKCDEIKKVKKAYECCAKQSQITREEYNNLRKEYKEIKQMLSEQIKRYKIDTADSTQCSHRAPSPPADLIKMLKAEITEKEKQIEELRCKVKEASYEIIELKDYTQKLVCDNNILKEAINNLIRNLERKIKGPSFASLPAESTENIAGEILHSLTAIENVILCHEDGVCPKECKGVTCDCLEEISGKYTSTEQPQVVYTAPEYQPEPKHTAEKSDCLCCVEGHSCANLTVCPEKTKGIPVIKPQEAKNIYYEETKSSSSRGHKKGPCDTDGHTCGNPTKCPFLSIRKPIVVDTTSSRGAANLSVGKTVSTCCSKSSAVPSDNASRKTHASTQGSDTNPLPVMSREERILSSIINSQTASSEGKKETSTEELSDKDKNISIVNMVMIEQKPNLQDQSAVAYIKGLRNMRSGGRISPKVKSRDSKGTRSPTSRGTPSKTLRRPASNLKVTSSSSKDLKQSKSATRRTPKSSPSRDLKTPTSRDLKTPTSRDLKTPTSRDLKTPKSSGRRSVKKSRSKEKKKSKKSVSTKTNSDTEKDDLGTLDQPGHKKEEIVEQLEGEIVEGSDSDSGSSDDFRRNWERH